MPGPYPGQSSVGDAARVIAGGRINHSRVVGQDHRIRVCCENDHRLGVDVIGAIGIPALDDKVVREAERELLFEGIFARIQEEINVVLGRLSNNLRVRLKMLSIENELKLGKPFLAPIIHGTPSTFTAIVPSGNWPASMGETNWKSFCGLKFTIVRHLCSR